MEKTNADLEKEVKELESAAQRKSLEARKAALEKFNSGSSSPGAAELVAQGGYRGYESIGALDDIGLVAETGQVILGPKGMMNESLSNAWAFDKAKLITFCKALIAKYGK